MNKYQIVESYGNHRHAGSKATNDCADILAELGFKELKISKSNEQYDFISKVKRQLSYVKEWSNLYSQVEENSILVLQHPFRRNQSNRFATLKKLKERKHVKLISLVHDVELIRDIFPDKFYRKELEQMLALSYKIIVHNAKMKQWFIDYGVAADRLISLEIFDYLNQEPLDKPIRFSNHVQIAGNLKVDKSPYAYHLQDLPDLNFDLFGIFYEPQQIPDNVHYHGSFSADEVPSLLESGFGLVWDGDRLDTCSGPTGNYLRYNNPHKLSLYLSSGIPVIVWEESAEAEFVKNHQLGLVVTSLYDLPKELAKISEEDYQVYIDNVKKVMKKLQEGHYLKQAIAQAIKDI
ncbi:glycosyl transferase [Streptococcus dentapri]|uniref:Glycosyl transferase n=1 Tax=Streptococcus dentapri TaxID=573564 RepID=A0ABV8D0K4_9STRE